MTPSPLQAIKLLLLDVDGVLTGGQIIYSDAGGEIKIFSVKDGLGIRMLQSAGIAVGIVTGRTSQALLARCRDLQISLIYDGVADKAALLQEILSRNGLSASEVAFVGDDLPDLGLMQTVGAAIAVADAHPMVKKTAHIVTTNPGGNGAVREVSEMILEAKNLLDKVMARWT